MGRLPPPFPPMQVVILASSTGWHTAELERAVRARGLEPRLLPWEDTVHRIGPESGVSNRDLDLLRVRAILPRIIPAAF